MLELLCVVPVMSHIDDTCVIIPNWKDHKAWHIRVMDSDTLPDITVVRMGYPRGAKLPTFLFNDEHGICVLTRIADIIQHVPEENTKLKNKLRTELETYTERRRRSVYTQTFPYVSFSALANIPTKGIYVRIGNDTTGFSMPKDLTRDDVKVSSHPKLCYDPIPALRNTRDVAAIEMATDVMATLDIFKLPRSNCPHDLFLRYEDALLYYACVPLSPSQQKLVSVREVIDPVVGQWVHVIAYNAPTN